MSRASKIVYHPHGDGDDFKDVEATLDDLDDRVTQNETDIATVQSDISDLEDRSNFTEASASDYRSNASGLKALTPETVWSAAGLVAFTDAATVALDFDLGFNWNGSIAGNRTLGNPTNPKGGQSGYIRVGASGAARTLTLSSNWKATTDITQPISIPNGQVAYIFYVVVTSTIIVVTSVLINPV